MGTTTWVLASTVLAVMSSHEVPFSFMENGDSAESQLDLGRRQLEAFRSQEPIYGACWSRAVADLQEGCKHLNEDVQIRLALAFSVCFLKKAGIPVRPCGDDRPVEDCVRNLEEREFSTYRQFFIHTQSVCFYLQSRQWQGHMEGTVFRLSSVSDRVSHQLEDSGRTQEKILSMQANSIRNQEQMVVTAHKMNLELEYSRRGVQRVFDDIKSTAYEQRVLMIDVFDRLAKLQRLVVGEFSTLYSLGFCVAACFVCYLLTSATRTADARFWLFLIFTGNVFLERIVTSYNVDEENKQASLLSVEGPISRRIWQARKLAILMASAITLYFAVTYKDYNKCNYWLLQQIREENQELRNEIRCIGFGDQKNRRRIGDSWSDTSDEDYRPKASVDTESEYSTSEEPCSSAESSPSSRLLEVGHGNRVPPLPPSTAEPEDDNALVAELGLWKRSKSNRRSGTPDSQASHYDLRPRAQQSFPRTPLGTESPRTFARTVHHLARAARRQNQTIQRAIRTAEEQHRPFFSSDDDR